MRRRSEMVFWRHRKGINLLASATASIFVVDLFAEKMLLKLAGRREGIDLIL